MYHNLISLRVVSHRFHRGFAEQKQANVNKADGGGRTGKLFEQYTRKWWSVLCVKTEKWGQGSPNRKERLTVSMGSALQSPYGLKTCQILHLQYK